MFLAKTKGKVYLLSEPVVGEGMVLYLKGREQRIVVCEAIRSGWRLTSIIEFSDVCDWNHLLNDIQKFSCIVHSLNSFIVHYMYLVVEAWEW